MSLSSSIRLNGGRAVEQGTYQPKHGRNTRSFAAESCAFATSRRGPCHDPTNVRGRARGRTVQFAFCGRTTPQRLRRERSVFGCRPRRRAAPRSPSITQRVSVSTCSTYQRSTSAIVARRRGVGRNRGRGHRHRRRRRRQIGQGVHVQHVAAREHDRALDHVLQLADVARPLVGDERATSPRARRRRCACRPGARSGAGSACTSGGMSSARSRSGGSAIGNTFSR